MKIKQQQQQQKKTTKKQRGTLNIVFVYRGRDKVGRFLQRRRNSPTPKILYELLLRGREGRMAAAKAARKRTDVFGGRHRTLPVLLLPTVVVDSFHPIQRTNPLQHPPPSPISVSRRSFGVLSTPLSLSQTLQPKVQHSAPSMFLFESVLPSVLLPNLLSPKNWTPPTTHSAKCILLVWKMPAYKMCERSN